MVELEALQAVPLKNDRWHFCYDLLDRMSGKVARSIVKLTGLKNSQV